MHSNIFLSFAALVLATMSAAAGPGDVENLTSLERRQGLGGLGEHSFIHLSRSHMVSPVD